MTLILRRAAADSAKLAVAAVVLLVAIAILWWTMGSGGKRKDLSGPLPTRAESAPANPDDASFGG